eukprot:scaffold71790_cov29-Tisochrysis_lutea.AAC.4
MESHRVIEEREQIGNGRLWVEPEFHVGVYACILGAVTKPRVATRVHPIGPLQVQRVARFRFEHRSDLVRCRPGEHDAGAATDEERVAGLVQRSTEIVSGARIISVTGRGGFERSTKRATTLNADDGDLLLVMCMLVAHHVYRAVPAQQLQKWLPQHVSVIINVHEPFGFSDLRPVCAH